MVHLQAIPNKDDIDNKLVKEVKQMHLDLAPAGDDDLYTTSVYGSRFAAADLPKHEMPEREMPKEVAYKMIKDDLSLDGNPMLNLASFVTTYMVCPSLTQIPNHRLLNCFTGGRSREAHDRVLLQELHRLRGVPAVS